MTTSTIPDLEVLSTAALATRWSVSQKYLANSRSAGQGPAYLKIGKSVLYAIEDVRAYEQARRVAR